VGFFMLGRGEEVDLPEEKGKEKKSAVIEMEV
jgi:hypothetical protein